MSIIRRLIDKACQGVALAAGALILVLPVAISAQQPFPGWRILTTGVIWDGGEGIQVDGAAAFNGAVTFAISPAGLGCGTLTGDVTSVLCATTIPTGSIVGTKLAANTVANDRLAVGGANTVKGTTDGVANSDVTATQLAALINACTATLKGEVPTPPNDATKTLLGTCAWGAVPTFPVPFAAGQTNGAAYTAGVTSFTGVSRPATDTEANAQFVFPKAGSISNLYVVLTVAPTGAETVALTLRQNGASSAVTCTVTGAALACNDTTHSFTVAAGDKLALQLVTSAGAASGKLSWGFTVQ